MVENLENLANQLQRLYQGRIAPVVMNGIEANTIPYSELKSLYARMSDVHPIRHGAKIKAGSPIFGKSCLTVYRLKKEKYYGRKNYQKDCETFIKKCTASHTSDETSRTQ